MIYRRPSRVAFVVSEGEEMQLHVKALPDGEVHVMVGAAAMIWRYAAEGQSDVLALVSKELGLDPAVIQDDVAHFLDHLVEMQLLEVADQSSG